MKKVKTALYIYRRIILEYFRFDSLFFSSILSVYYLIIIKLLQLVKELYEIKIAGKMFKRSKGEFFRTYATLNLIKVIQTIGVIEAGKRFRNSISVEIDEKITITKSIKQSNVNLFNKRLLIISEPTKKEKGVIIVGYNREIGCFANIFDLEKLSKYYVVIIEPSTTGFYDTDILSFLSDKLHVIVQTFENEVDGKFLIDLNQNLYPVRCAANQWVDQRLFFPIANTFKSYDIIMVAIWHDVKRHYELFQAMKNAKKNIRVALVGVPWGNTIECIKAQANLFGILDQIDWFENLSPYEVNKLLNQSKFCILLSKKEGSNRAVVESLFAGTPILIRKGLNYGYQYPLLNSKTGIEFNSKELPAIIDSIDDVYFKGKFTPHEWANTNISAIMSNIKLVKALENIEKKSNTKINKRIALKVNNPEMDYYETNYWNIFKEHYKELSTFLR